MKTSILAAALLLHSFVARPQEVATSLSPSAIEHHDTPGPARSVGSVTPIPSLGLSVAEIILTPPLETVGTPEFGYAAAQLNGVEVQVQTLAASGTVLITFSTPPQQHAGLIELVDAQSGRVLYTGSVLRNNGQVELPVADPLVPFEVRLATDHNVVIARMVR